MAYNILILGASYGSLLGTKLLMAGHNVTLVCRAQTADLINTLGTEVRIKLKGEEHHRSFRSSEQPGTLHAAAPDEVAPAGFDMVVLAMQEPQYAANEIWQLMKRIAAARVPCLSLMNMPPLPYLRRLPGLQDCDLDHCYTNARVWDGFDPELVTLCSPDPQAFRPPEEKANVLHVGLPTNFKTAPFANPAHNAILEKLETDIAAVQVDGLDIPVKLKLYDSLYVPLAKWSMLLAGNYRCVTSDGVRPIKDAVHGNISQSEDIYNHVAALVRHLGADPADQVPFAKYAKAAETLLKPSSAARAIAAGTPTIERVDRLVQQVGHELGMHHDAVDETVAIVDARLAGNQQQVA